MTVATPNESSSLQTWLDYQLAMHPVEIDMGLERVSRVAKRLGLTDFSQIKVITVAGTNGKGSTCAMLESVLMCAGKKVGVYSSPHMLKYNERVRIAGQDCEDATFVDAFHQIERARQDISLTFFEYATLAGLLILKAAKIDVAILEVGLGGRLDATNIVDADISVITSIDIDHESYLGNTRELVGFEKAGIFRRNRLAVVGEPDVPISVLQHAKNTGVVLYRVDYDFSYQEFDDHWTYQGQQRQISQINKPKLPLPNAATCLAVLEQGFAEIGQQVIMQGIENAGLTGRFERVSTQPTIILDVAHNPHAAKYLATQLKRLDGTRIFGLCGMLEDKDIVGVLHQLSSVVDDWYLIDLHVDRGASASKIATCLPKDAKYSECEQISAAWNVINQQISADDVVIVFGSFYTVAAFKSFMQQEIICV